MGMFTLLVSAGILCVLLGLIADMEVSVAASRFLLAGVYLLALAAISLTFGVAEVHGW